jgi:hypothetical protein
MSSFAHTIGRLCGVEYFSTRRALRAAQTTKGQMLLILPSTMRAFRFVDSLAKTRPCYVATGPLVAQRRWHANVVNRTPAEIIKSFRSAGTMTAPVICFPDQLIGEGNSFIEIPFMDERRIFSILEATLVLRYRPVVFGFTSNGPLGHFQLRQISNGPHDALDLAELQRHLLSLLQSELQSNPSDWVAAQYFRLKSRAVYDSRLREELKDVLALLMLEITTSPNNKRLVAAARTAMSEIRRMNLAA